MPKFAESVHVDPEKHTFTVDGEPFPWYISEAGPAVRQIVDGLFEVHVVIFAHDGFVMPKLAGAPASPVIAGREFPWYITEDGVTLTSRRWDITQVELSFLARDVSGIPVEDCRNVWTMDGSIVQRSDA
jgi:hypothetical protein